MTEEIKEEKKKKKVDYARYVGGGKFLTGVPARDLTAEEWEAYSKAERDHFIKLGLYEVIYG